MDLAADRIRREFFEQSRERLQSTLELLQSYEQVSSLAPSIAPLVHLYKVPLVSDIQAKNLHHSFSTPQPNILSSSTAPSSPVLWDWAEIASLRWYAIAPQRDGTYHLLLPGVFTAKLSKFDYDMLVSMLPHKMIDLMSYASDVSAEINVTRLAMAQVELWKDLASQGSFRIQRRL